MAYTTTTAGQFITLIGGLMDDPNHKYWTVNEIQWALNEALRVWGVFTNYWRERGTLVVSPADSTPYHDLSVCMPVLRPRTVTLDQIVKEIQSMLLEPASGIAGTGMSKQITVQAILDAVKVSRNRFTMDARLPFSVHADVVSPPPPEGQIETGQDVAFVHKVSWQDLASGAWTNLQREDSYAIDRSNLEWLTQPGTPRMFSESDLSPLKFVISPIPQSGGKVEIVSIDSLDLDTTDAASLLAIPDEWAFSVKYATLSYILSGEGEIKDAERAAYAEQRYQQSLDIAKTASSIIRATSSSTQIPLALDTLTSVDSGRPYWRNQTGPIEYGAGMYDLFVPVPGIPDREYGIALDVVRSAPIPGWYDYIQVGMEELDRLVDYVTHILVFKCGGKDFSSTFSSFDSFQKGVQARKSTASAKMRYISTTVGQAQREWQGRPDSSKTSR